MELFRYYNLSESANADLILAKLELLSQELKIDYSYMEDREVVKLMDLDLSDDELKELVESFENNDVLPDLDFGERNDEDDGFIGYDGDEYDF